MKLVCANKYGPLCILYGAEKGGEKRGGINRFCGAGGGGGGGREGGKGEILAVAGWVGLGRPDAHFSLKKKIYPFWNYFFAGEYKTSM